MNSKHDLDRAFEAHLAEMAENLLAERARKTGLKPRTLLRQAAPEVESPREDTAESGVVRTLLARLARRDQGLT